MIGIEKYFKDRIFTMDSIMLSAARVVQMTDTSRLPTL